jgi:DNA-binding MarR family transcriptional regulator
MAAAKQPPRRQAHIAALNRTIREATGLGVLYAEAVAARLGINTTDLECLGVIEARGEASAGELAAATGLTSGAITGVIDRLEEAGLARRHPDARDRRKLQVRMTPSGRARATVHYRRIARAADAIAARYDDDTLALLVDYFTRSRDMMRAEIARLKNLG